MARAASNERASLSPEEETRSKCASLVSIMSLVISD